MEASRYHYCQIQVTGLQWNPAAVKSLFIQKQYGDREPRVDVMNYFHFVNVNAVVFAFTV